MTEARRKALQELLINSDVPLTGTYLAKLYGVSRQVIVQDIAVLRASGVSIVGGLNGYSILMKTSNGLQKTFVSHHHGEDRIEEELQIVVDYGGKMLNIAVSHPIYGEIVCPLAIKSREDIREFMLKLKDEQAAPLSSLTEGIHYHTIEVESEATYIKIIKRLEEKGFIPHNAIG